MKKTKLLTPFITTSLLVCPVLTIVTSCNKTDKVEELVKTLYQDTYDEFFGYASIPHPSYSLDKAREYLTEKIKGYGFDIERDTYGNIWFDIPASDNKLKSNPKLILQAHMDMVVRGLTEEEAKTTGISLTKTKDKDGREIIQSTGAATGVGKATTIGADDGIGVAMILAIAKNANGFSHGPFRCILTADEEEGLIGANHLPESALDSDYLLNLDGEGAENKEYVVQRGCAGMYECRMENSFVARTETTLNKYSISIKGFAGGHYNDEYNIRYDKDKGKILRANADRFLLEVLYKICGKQHKTVEIAEFNHVNETGVDVEFEPRHLPTHATVEFASNATQNEVDTAIMEVYENFKTRFKGENWKEIEQPSAKTGLTFTHVLDDETSFNLIKLFGDDLKISVQSWEGNTEEENIYYNYPTKSSNMSAFSIKYVPIDDVDVGKMQFSASGRGVSGTDAYALELANMFKDNYAEYFPTMEGYTVKKDYGPWDANGEVKKMELINMAVEGYKYFNVTPKIERTRGGVEPATFDKKRPTIQQAVIGPRIENVHFTNETLYLDTIPNVIRCSLYVIYHMKDFK